MEKRVIYFDLIGGASGDMLLSSLLSAGFKLSSLERLIKGLGLKGVKVIRRKVEAGHIRALRTDFTSPKEIDLSFRQIQTLIKKAKLPAKVKTQALDTYEVLRTIEEKIHGHTRRDLHFQHLGKLDALLEITSFWLALEELGIEQRFCSWFPLSNTSPATIDLLKGRTVRMVDWGYETVTPTAAALLRDCTQGEVELVPLSSGYGIGSAGSATRPDLVRALIGRAIGASEKIFKLEVNIDDMNPQVFDHLMDLLFDAGALDVYITPIIMKKSRPAHCLSVLLEKKDLPGIEKIVFAHTTTFGLRYAEFKRDRLASSFVRKKTPFGTMQFRRGSFNGRYNKEYPEYNDCKKAASKYNIPLIEVYKKLSSSK
ncbi:LarC family nickel insertion protein [Candidatus Omnitrophota bacterium]